MTAIDDLRQKIDEAASAYYNRGVSIVSDDEFDTMLDMLRRLDHKDERLTRIGFEPTLEKVEHAHPMGSLDNIDANKPNELQTYIKRNKDYTLADSLYHVTPKIDGSSIALTYKGGVLTQVLTRGNGEVGQDITAKASFFKGVPTKLPEPVDITVRGEAVMHRDVFIKYIESAQLEGVRNPRNVGNGIIVRKDACGAGLINFYSFNVESDTPIKILDSVHRCYQFLQEMGFTTPDYQIVAADGITTLVDTMIQRDYPFDIDGLVIRVDDMRQREIINEGGDDLRPRSDQAIKFNSKKAETTITGVTVTVGSTGKITPTLTVEPVEIGGIVNSNVLIYNYDEPERLKIGIGDKIRVVLAGDIIPKVLCVVDKASPPTVITAPKTCPSCDHPISRKQLLKGESVDLYCTNQKCPGIQFEKIQGFIGSSKRGMGILGIGEHLINHLITSGHVKSIPDLYDLTEDQLRIMSLGNGVVGAKRAKTIVNNIQESKGFTVQKVVGSLGIDGLGEHRAEIMMEVADGGLATLDDWIACANGSELILNLKHPHLPANVMASVQSQLVAMKDDLLRLRELGVGVHVAPVVTEDGGPKPFAGKTFCFTGTRIHLDIVEKLGGEVKSGVSKTLDFLVQRDKSERTSKAKKAEAYGTTVIGVPELETMIKEADPTILGTASSGLAAVFEMLD